MNVSVKYLVDDFLKREERNSVGDPEDFEDFCNFSIISREYKSEFSLEDVSMGETQGIDGLAILVNGNLVSTTEEIDDLVGENHFLEATFIFIQAKTKESFDGADISRVFVSIQDFFDDKPKLRSTNEIQRAIDLKDKIWGYYSFMTKGKPICKIYYVSTGKWVSEEKLVSTVERNRSNLTGASDLGDVIFIPCGASEIQEYYLQTKRATKCEFMFDNQIPLPVEGKVEEAYFGIVKFREFTKIISDS